MTTKVVNVKTGEYFDIFIGRGRVSVLGNPFKIGRDGNRQEVVEMFKSYFYERLKRDPEYKAVVLSLRDKVIGCFCKPRLCHGDIYVEYLDGTR